jgi:hypothetical protein
MKLNLKTILLTVILGGLCYLLSYSLSHYKNNQNNKTQVMPLQKQTKIIDKKQSELPAPKAYISPVPEQNGLEIGNNWRSR